MMMPFIPWPRAQVILAQKAALSLQVSPSDQVDSMAVAFKELWLPLAVVVIKGVPAP